MLSFFFFQAEDGIRDGTVTGVQTCALPISRRQHRIGADRRLRRDAAVVAEIRRPLDRVEIVDVDAFAEPDVAAQADARRSEERRVGKEGRSRRAPYDHKQKKEERTIRTVAW